MSQSQNAKTWLALERSGLNTKQVMNAMNELGKAGLLGLGTSEEIKYEEALDISKGE